MRAHHVKPRLPAVWRIMTVVAFATGCHGTIVNSPGGRGGTGAGGPPISPSGNHPRLWFGDAATLARAKAWYQANKGTLSWDPQPNDQSLNALHSILAGDSDQSNCRGGS